MALQKDYINEFGETIPNCYWKIGSKDGITGGKLGMRCKVYCYENKEQADLNQNELFVFPFEFDFDMGNVENIFIKLYRHLKSFTILENAVDV